MPHAAAARMASRDRDAGRYRRHRPEQTLLYQIVDEYCRAFAAHLAEQGRELPSYVQREFEEFLKCGWLEHGFLRVLGVVHRVIATHLVRKSGYTHDRARTGAVTLIQRFGSALNLNIHFHMLFLDGVYVDQPNGAARFRWVKSPSSAEITRLTHTITRRSDCSQGCSTDEAENQQCQSVCFAHATAAGVRSAGCRKWSRL